MGVEIIKLDDSLANSNDVKIPPSLLEKIKVIKAESLYWDKAFSQVTPDENVEIREGSKGEFFEYVKDSYTMRRLNDLYPGWYTDEMKIEYIPNVATFVVSGYIIIEYITLEGPKRRKIWAVGASQVQMKRDKDIATPSQPDDVAKSAYTEWIKLVGKRLGIGLDIFEQSITDEMKAEYAERTKHYKHTNITDEIVKTIKSKKVFNAYVNNLPTSEQALDLASVSIPEDKERAVWDAFQKNQKSTVSTLIKQVKEKLKGV